MLYAINKDADQPAHPCSLISIFVVRCLNSRMPIFAISKIARLYLASVAKQAGLYHNWSQNPEERSSLPICAVTYGVVLCGGS